MEFKEQNCLCYLGWRDGIVSLLCQSQWGEPIICICQLVYKEESREHFALTGLRCPVMLHELLYAINHGLDLNFSHKPAKVNSNNTLCKSLQVTPLTALKFAELAAKAGIPKGVINIIPGSGNHHRSFTCYLIICYFLYMYLLMCIQFCAGMKCKPRKVWRLVIYFRKGMEFLVCNIDSRPNLVPTLQSY